MKDLTNYFKELKIITEYELAKQIKISWELYKKGKLTWTTKKGKDILVRKMTDVHLTNSINFMRSNKHIKFKDCYTNAIIAIFEKELEKRAAVLRKLNK